MNIPKTMLYLFVIVSLVTANGRAQLQEIPAEIRAEARSAVAAEKLAERERAEQERAKKLAIPAISELEDTYPDGSTVLYRRLEDRERSPELATAPETVAVTSASQPPALGGLTSGIMLTISSGEAGISQIHWQQGQQSWSIQTNADLRGLQSHHQIPYQEGNLTLFIINLQKATSEVSASNEYYFEVKDPQAPQALLDQLAALHDYYLERQPQFLENAMKQQAMQEERQQWEQNNPEPPKQTVINFFKIR